MYRLCGYIWSKEYRKWKGNDRERIPVSDELFCLLSGIHFSVKKKVRGGYFCIQQCHWCHGVQICKQFAPTELCSPTLIPLLRTAFTHLDQQNTHPPPLNNNANHPAVFHNASQSSQLSQPSPRPLFPLLRLHRPLPLNVGLQSLRRQTLHRSQTRPPQHSHLSPSHLLYPRSRSHPHSHAIHLPRRPCPHRRQGSRRRRLLVGTSARSPLFAITYGRREIATLSDRRESCKLWTSAQVKLR